MSLKLGPLPWLMIPSRMARHLPSFAEAKLGRRTAMFARSRRMTSSFISGAYGVPASTRSASTMW